LGSGVWQPVTSGVPFTNVLNGVPMSGLMITNVQPAAFFRMQPQ
jgi:hypothetical protein